MKSPLGHLLLIESPSAAWSPALERLLARFQPAGLAFRGLGTLTAAAEVCRKAASALDAAPFLAVEEDGGGPLGGLLAPGSPAVSLGQLEQRSAEALGKLVGAAMELAGLNFDLAPTVDLSPAATQTAERTSRSRLPIPSGQPAEVTCRAEAFIRGLARHRVLPCVRRFPGLPAALDGLAPVVDRTMIELWRQDLLPYRTLAAKLPMVEISHAVYKAYDYEFPRPASLSPSVVEGLLRLKLRYQGVALANALLSSRAAGIEVSETAVRALGAGCDLVLVPGDEKSLDAVVTAVERAVDFGQLPRERIEQALGRTRHARRSLATVRRQPSERDLARLANEFEAFRRRHAAPEQTLG